jgi:uncharacterized protein YbbC (DUF1343 family)
LYDTLSQRKRYPISMNNTTHRLFWITFAAICCCALTCSTPEQTTTATHPTLPDTTKPDTKPDARPDIKSDTKSDAGSLGEAAQVPATEVKHLAAPKSAAEILEKYIYLMHGKRLGLVVNQTSMVGSTHLVDTLRSLGCVVEVIFAPEHGFRGTADAGAKIKSGIDANTGLPIISLYGNKKAPSAEDLSNIDMLVFDIQDVGARFYTYLSTLYYVMDAAAKHQKEVLVLDRPNPNGHYVDGPVLEVAQKSFVGVLPIPMVHGCTLGELAKMMVGEAWLPSGSPKLTVMPCKNYTHQSTWHLEVPPSPNLRTDRAIALYPTLCLFEGTVISVGRGTEHPFEMYGSPLSADGGYVFTPKSTAGASQPLYQNQVCKGRSFDAVSVEHLRANAGIDWQIILDAYQNYPKKEDFFLKTKFFDRLAGSDQIQKAIKKGKSPQEIRALYAKDLETYKRLRNKYLLYE